MFDEIIKKWGGHEVSAMQVYTDLFGLGEGLIQRQDEEPGEFKSNPLGYQSRQSTTSIGVTHRMGVGECL